VVFYPCTFKGVSMNKVHKIVKDLIDGNEEMSYAYMTNKDMRNYVRMLGTVSDDEDAIQMMVINYFQLLKVKI
jgi:hypothetical protein